MSLRFLIRNARRISDSADHVTEGDFFLHGGELRAVETVGDEFDREIDAQGAYLGPAFVDLYAHVGEPGYEYKEDIETAGRAAAAGGFSDVCVSPLSEPVNDCRSITEQIIHRADELGGPRFRPIASLTIGAAGQRLTEMFDLRDSGAVGVGDGEHSRSDAALMRRALEYAQGVGLTVFEWSTCSALAGKGVMHEGAVATRLGMKGIPVAAEEVRVGRAIALARQTRASLHIGPLSSSVGVELVRRAKADGVPVTASVASSHLLFSDADIAEEWDVNLHVNPPLRSSSDRHALIAGIKDGTIDAVSSGHRPQSLVEKEVPFPKAEPGMLGLEQTFERLVTAGLSIEQCFQMLSSGPRRILGRSFQATTDYVLVDPTRANDMKRPVGLSRSKNMPTYLGGPTMGRVLGTWIRGRLSHQDQELMMKEAL